MKQHLRNTTALVSDYPNSPHVSGAIEDGTLTACGLITDRITDTRSEVTCMACWAVANSHARVIQISSGKRVDYEEVMAIKARRKEINDLNLTEIEWYRDGKPMEVDPLKLDEFKFIGLSNFDFLTFEVVSDTTTGGVQVTSIRI